MNNVEERIPLNAEDCLDLISRIVILGKKTYTDKLLDLSEKELYTLTCVLLQEEKVTTSLKEIYQNPDLQKTLLNALELFSGEFKNSNIEIDISKNLKVILEALSKSEKSDVKSKVEKISLNFADLLKVKENNNEKAEFKKDESKNIFDVYFDYFDKDKNLIKLNESKEIKNLVTHSESKFGIIEDKNSFLDKKSKNKLQELSVELNNLGKKVPYDEECNNFFINLKVKMASLLEGKRLDQIKVLQKTKSSYSISQYKLSDNKSTTFQKIVDINLETSLSKAIKQIKLIIKELDNIKDDKKKLDYLKENFEIDLDGKKCLVM